jgi:hypothetical protein
VRSVLTAVVSALALVATEPAAAGHSPEAGTPRFATGGGPAHTPRAATPRSTRSDVVARVLATDEGTFSATYLIGPPHGRRGPTQTLTVAQRAASGRSAFLDPRGEWSYLLTSSNGTLVAWTQIDGRATWCQRLLGHGLTRCGGPVTVERSNGFSELQSSFITGTAVDSLRATLAGNPTSTLTVTTSGAVAEAYPGASCLVARSGASRWTWCVAGRRLVSGFGVLTGPFLFGTATLRTWAPRAPAADFSPTHGCPSTCPRTRDLPGF